MVSQGDLTQGSSRTSHHGSNIIRTFPFLCCHSSLCWKLSPLFGAYCLISSHPKFHRAEAFLSVAHLLNCIFDKSYFFSISLTSNSLLCRWGRTKGQHTMTPSSSLMLLGFHNSPAVTKSPEEMQPSQYLLALLMYCTIR